MKLRGIWERGQRAWQRRAARWFGRRPFTIVPGRPLVSFTFDDFPRSALVTGGAILDEFHVAATYYVALGLAGRTTDCGEMFRRDELPSLLELGHELGCHTYEHCPAWPTAPEQFEEQVQRNASALKQFIPSASFRTHSYPLTSPRPATKERLGRYMACCRGGGQTFNTGTVDRNHLAGFFLEQSSGDASLVRQIARANAAAGGWLIFATHDVSPQPSRFGCTPEFFRQAVAAAIESGAEIKPVAQAWDTLCARAGRS